MKNSWIALALTCCLPFAAVAFDLDTSLVDADASFWGEVAEDHAGLAVAVVGDVDGDGYADLVIGAPANDVTDLGAGQVYLVFGDPALAPDTSLALASASFLGEMGADYAGDQVAAAGDVNGDGYADFLIGAFGNDELGADSGKVYLVLGGSGGWAMDTDLGLADASWIGDAGDSASTGIDGGGDLDGDGYDDLVISAPNNGEAGAEAGQVYVVFGSDSGWATNEWLADATTSFLGESAQDHAGASVAIAGDVNADGYADLLIGAPENDVGGSESGQTYLVFGKAVDWDVEVDLGTADASFWGEAVADNAGTAVAGAGDVDGDGYDDMLISAPRNDDGAIEAGQTYLILGRSAGWIQDIHLSVADASFLGEMANDQSGYALSAAGDTDSDGYDDFLIGAPFNEESTFQDGGQVYLVMGSASGLAPDTSLGSVDASFWAESQFSRVGTALGGGSDVNGDGYGDFLLSAPYNAEGGIATGQVYLLYGQAPPCNDVDLDGYGVPGTPNCTGGSGTDCDDTDPTVYPGAADDACDGIDNDCNGITDELNDVDGDGWSTCDGDCDEYEPLTYPGAYEECDGLDNNCNGSVPVAELDADGDGQHPCGGDCDDTDPTIYLGASEVCDGVDNNCDGAPLEGEDEDQDGDGWMACIDCDDADATLTLDDADGDGYSTCDGDCNDLNPLLSPEDADQDGSSLCDGDCDDNDATVDLADEDGDGWSTCDGDCDDEDSWWNPADADGDGFSTCVGDCDDTDAAVNPFEEEVCGDGVDNDCSGVVDDKDADGDDHVDDACDGGTDCNDEDFYSNPDEDEECDDEEDNDCDGLVDLEDDECDGDDDDDTTGDDDTDDDDTTDDDTADDDTADDDSAEGEEGGCECHAAGSQRAPALALLPALLALLLRRM